jgi:outer membrane protein OmpA-like peptidoglycan-associated protein
VLDPRSQEQDKKRIKQALAKNNRDSLASSDVGYYMDVLQGRLTQMAGNNVGVDRHGDRIVLDLSSRSGFETGSAQINPGFREILTPLSKVLVEYRMTLVSVHVGTDDAGTQATSPLAALRAQAVAHYLAKTGVAGKRIVIVIVRSDPVELSAAKTKPANRALVELQLEPIVRAVGAEH